MLADLSIVGGNQANSVTPAAHPFDNVAFRCARWRLYALRSTQLYLTFWKRRIRIESLIDSHRV